MSAKSITGNESYKPCRAGVEQADADEKSSEGKAPMRAGKHDAGSDNTYKPARAGSGK